MSLLKDFNLFHQTHRCADHIQALNNHLFVTFSEGNADMDTKQFQDALNNHHWSAQLLVQVVCPTYFGVVGIDLREPNKLDARKWQLAVAITGHRRTPGWSDAEFYELACWCQIRHNLA